MSKELDKFTRRQPLASLVTNPIVQQDYLVELKGRLTQGDQLVLQYVPDRNICPSASFETYLQTLSTIDWPTPESLAAAILDDVNNELIPRWVMVTIRRNDSRLTAHNHRVVVIDAQPDWENPDFLDRLSLSD